MIPTIAKQRRPAKARAVWTHVELVPLLLHTGPPPAPVPTSPLFCAFKLRAQRPALGPVFLLQPRLPSRLTTLAADATTGPATTRPDPAPSRPRLHHDLSFPASRLPFRSPPCPLSLSLSPSSSYSRASLAPPCAHANVAQRPAFCQDWERRRIPKLPRGHHQLQSLQQGLRQPRLVHRSSARVCRRLSGQSPFRALAGAPSTPSSADR